MKSELQKLIFELSVKGRKAYSLPAVDVEHEDISTMLPREYMRKDSPKLPEVSEVDVIRHFINLSNLNHSVDNGFYPLGSCTMKYNPKINEDAARLSGFAKIHPDQPAESVQGALHLLYDLDKFLSEITGMHHFTLQPVAGAHGEITGLFLIKAYHESRGEHHRNIILVPDSSHGTNPASAAGVGMKVVQVKSDNRGNVDMEDLQSKLTSDVAALMLTNPNTLGLFDEHITDIASSVHEAGALLYYDGANANAIMGKTRPGDMGFDVIHLNLHKTFSTPHGGGGPGSGTVGVKSFLEPFLPAPIIKFDEEKHSYFWDEDRPQSIGRVHSFNGNFAIMVRAYSYIRSMGPDGLKAASEHAVLNANYVMRKLEDFYDLPYDRECMHEFVFSGSRQKKDGQIKTLDMAKRLLDFGYHAPTIYFPLIVDEAMMIEPTETESKETLDDFIDVMKLIAKEAKENPEMLHNAPSTTVIGRLDEAQAARKPILRWTK